MTRIRYRGCTITPGPAYTPCTVWEWYADEYDPTPEHSFDPPDMSGSGGAATIEDAMAEIDEYRDEYPEEED